MSLALLNVQSYFLTQSLDERIKNPKFKQALEFFAEQGALDKINQEQYQSDLLQIFKEDFPRDNFQDENSAANKEMNGYIDPKEAQSYKHIAHIYAQQKNLLEEYNKALQKQSLTHDQIHGYEWEQMLKLAHLESENRKKENLTWAEQNVFTSWARMVFTKKPYLAHNIWRNQKNIKESKVVLLSILSSLENLEKITQEAVAVHRELDFFREKRIDLMKKKHMQKEEGKQKKNIRKIYSQIDQVGNIKKSEQKSILGWCYLQTYGADLTWHAWGKIFDHVDLVGLDKKEEND